MPIKELLNIRAHHEELIAELAKMHDADIKEEKVAELKYKLSIVETEIEKDKVIGRLA